MSAGAVYTEEQLEWLRVNYQTAAVSALVIGFNAIFGQARTAVAIKGILFRKGGRSGRTGYFSKGDESWNKGKKGFMGANATSFRMGDIPANTKPLWSERISKDGLVEMKVPESNPYTGHTTRFKHKHVWIWEQTNGPRPKGQAIVFRDGNNRNFAIDNLMLVSRAELLIMNQHGYHQTPDDLKPAVLTLVKVEMQAKFRTRPGQGRRKKEVVA